MQVPQRVLDAGQVMLQDYGVPVYVLLVAKLAVEHPTLAVTADPSQTEIAVAITSDPTLPARSDGYFGALMRLLDGPVMVVA